MGFGGADVAARGTHLLAFADGSARWRRAGRRFAREASASGWFSRVTVCDATTLDELEPGYVSRRAGHFTDDSPGFGLYAWKPFLMSRYLATPGLRADRVAYIDTGCHLNVRPQSTLRWRQHEERTDDAGTFFLHMPGLPEQEWTKPAVLDHFGLSSAQRASPQILSGIWMLANDTRARELMARWEAAMTYADGALARDPVDGDEAGPFLRAHRHDQSVLSCLLKSCGAPTVADETFFDPDWESAGADYPIWALRNRSGVRYRRQRAVFRATRAAEKALLALRR